MTKLFPGVERVCQNEGCRKSFWCQPFDIKRGKKFCSRSCYTKQYRTGRKPLTIEEQIDRFLPKGKPNNQCWEWTGPLDHSRGGYGRLCSSGKMFLAHRKVFESFNDVRLKSEQCVLHDCDNPPCCNPYHLFLGTKGDNNKDAASKGRSANGTKIWTCKLTEDKVRQLRTDDKLGLTTKELSAKYGVSTAQVRLIVLRHNWKNI